MPGTTLYKSKATKRWVEPDVILKAQLGEHQWGVPKYNPKAEVRDRLPVETHSYPK
jgi:hypothetical protein